MSLGPYAPKNDEEYRELQAVAQSMVATICERNLTIGQAQWVLFHAGSTEMLGVTCGGYSPERD